MVFLFGAPEGTRTHTLKAREPKSRMSTNSITGAYRIFDLIEYSTVFPLEQEVFPQYNELVLFTL